MADEKNDDTVEKSFTVPEGFKIPAHRHAVTIGKEDPKPQPRPGSEQLTPPAPPADAAGEE